MKIQKLKKPDNVKNKGGRPSAYAFLKDMQLQETFVLKFKNLKKLLSAKGGLRNAIYRLKKETGSEDVFKVWIDEQVSPLDLLVTRFPPDFYEDN